MSSTITSTYYIDFSGGRENDDGLSPERATNHYSDLSLLPGDRVLFRRGSFVRGTLKAAPHVSYGAYGEGELPTFCGSVDVSDEGYWEPSENENVWKCTKRFRGYVGNLIFNTNECTAALRWTKEDLCSQGDFFSTPANADRTRNDVVYTELYFWSVGNPGKVYSHIEAAEYGDRGIVKLANGTTFEDIRIMNSGVHGMSGSASGVTVRRCVFENIGGCPWSVDSRIRFGNGFEIWQKGNDILIEDCLFRNIYDSCVTHQGPGKETEAATGFICRNCTFDTYGMAAFEYRDKLPVRSVFEHNVCLNAGCGFAMLGETLPRMSEIWPLPMGHHIFLWRISEPTEGGCLTIRDNVFGPAPVGASIYSIISPEAEAQITLQNNRYAKENPLLCHFGGVDHTELAEFQRQTGNDAGSTFTASTPACTAR